jgi:hypothetical protein
LLGNEGLNLETGRYYDNKSMVPPVYYLANGRKGNCVPTTVAHMTVLLSKGYNCTLCEADGTPDDGEDRINHAFSETSIGGKIYIVNFNVLTPREDKNGINNYEKWGWRLSDNYDPNWFKNENHNYM